MNPMKILIATGIYPPEIGGPAQYALNLKDIWTKEGHGVKVDVFSRFNFLPTGIRHIAYFFYILPDVFSADFILVLDTYSCAFPTVFASRLFRKKVVLRTGGDFLWESHVERTRKPVLLRNFYKERISYLSTKEKIVYGLTKWILKNTSKVVFSTNWQKDIFTPAYDLDSTNTTIVENYYGPKEGDFPYKNHTFVGSSRDLIWKNLVMLGDVFSEIKSAGLFLDNLPFDEFMNKINDSYAVIQVSLGDISPNLILDSIRMNKPFICTKEVGIFDRIKDAGIFVDPLNKEEIKQAVLELLDPDKYKLAQERVRHFSFTHTWKEIGDEFLSIYNSIK